MYFLCLFDKVSFHYLPGVTIYQILHFVDINETLDHGENFQMLIAQDWG